MPDLRAYPYDRWPRLTREEAATLRAQARSGPLRALAIGSAPAAEWLGAPPRVALSSGPRVETCRPGDPVAAILLEAPSGARAALVLGAGVASVLVDRTLGGDGAGLMPAAGPLGEIEQGVLAYAVGRWLAEGGSSFQVAAALTSGAALAEALGPGPHVRWALDLDLAGARGGAVLWVPLDARAGEVQRRIPPWADALPVEVCACAGTAVLEAAQLATLAPGDVVVPDRTELALEEGRLGGALEIGAGELAWRAVVEGDGVRIVEPALRAPARSAGPRPGPESESAPESAPERRLAREKGGSTVTEKGRMLEKLGDTPVTLSLELTRFALPLAEVAALAPGEVLRTGAPIGERVRLRAGDRTVAVGELVDVEGEIGVRILELPE